MRSDAQAATSVDEQSPVFQIGRQVLLTVEHSSRPQIELGEARSIQIAAGDHVFRLHQMRENINPAALPARLQDNLASLPALFPLSTADWNSFLRHLFGMAASVLRLNSDEKFLAVATDLLTAAGTQFQMQLHQINGSKAKVAIVPRRSGPLPDELLLFFDDTKLAVGRIDVTENVLMHPNSRNRLVGIKSSGNVSGSQAALLGAKGISRVEIDLHTYASFEEFYRQNERENFDLVSLLAQLSDAGAPMLPALSEERRLANNLHDRRLNVRFELTKGLSLDHGFFAAGWLFDQEEQIAEVVVVDHTLQDPSLLDAWKQFHGRVEVDGKAEAVRRFLAFVPRRPGHRPPEDVRLRVTLKNGQSYLVSPESVSSDALSQRHVVLESIAAYSFSREQFNEVFRPAIEPLQTRLNDLQRVREKREFGNRSARAISIIIPIYREMEFLRSQLMAFALDPFVREQCEIVYCLDDPLIALPFTSKMAGYSSAFPLDVKIIVLDRNGGYALANNLAARNAAGETLVLMNSDVIPIRPGWVEAGLEALDKLPEHSVVGPKLLYPDGSIQHAGMYFHRAANKLWQNVHFTKGYGSDLPSANIDREVPAVTGACMFVRKSDYLDVDGFCDDYVTGDFEDSDLCLKLRSKGGLAFYAASIELYHFERQSMAADANKSASASTLYNEALHTSKWDSLIPSVNEVAIAYSSESPFDAIAEPVTKTSMA